MCNLLHSLFSLIPRGPNIFLSNLFSNTLSLWSSLNVTDQVSEFTLNSHWKSNHEKVAIEANCQHLLYKGKINYNNKKLPDYCYKLRKLSSYTYTKRTLVPTPALSQSTRKRYCKMYILYWLRDITRYLKWKLITQKADFTSSCDNS